MKQIIVLALLVGALILVWRWQDGQTERIQAKAADGVHIIDGDSFSIGRGNTRRTVRLSGIDAPEYTQSCYEANKSVWACGKEARRTLVSLVGKGKLDCTVTATDKYHRAVSMCAVAGVPDIGRDMVRQGMAVSGADISSSRFNDGGPYLVEEAQAKRNKRGIWRGSFERPADWRARTKTAVPGATGTT